MFKGLIKLAGKRKSKLAASCLLLILSSVFSVFAFSFVIPNFVRAFPSLSRSNKHLVSCSFVAGHLRFHLHYYDLCL